MSSVVRSPRVVERVGPKAVGEHHALAVLLEFVVAFLNLVSFLHAHPCALGGFIHVHGSSGALSLLAQPLTLGPPCQGRCGVKKRTVNRLVSFTNQLLIVLLRESPGQQNIMERSFSLSTDTLPGSVRHSLAYDA